MLSLDEALARLAAGAREASITDTETVPTMEALGRVLAEDLHSLVDVPPADNSAMDGYALHAADVPAAGTLLPVSQRIPAGTVGAPLQPGTAARIFTGAQVPAGADAVVMQEQCEAADGAVRIQVLPTPGLAIRRRGEDVRRGAVVLARGSRLTPQGLGLAAAVGAGRLQVLRRLPWGMLVQLYGQVELRDFSEPVANTQAGSLDTGETENNVLLLRLVKDVTPDYSVEVRYGRYRNEAITLNDFYTKNIYAVGMNYRP